MEHTLNDDQIGRLPTPNQANMIGKLDAGAMSIYMGQPVLADVDRIVDEYDIAVGAATILAQPDTPRNLTGTLTDADDSVTATVTITGVDPQGRTVTEVMQITLGVGKTWTGTKIFASVTSVVVSALSGQAGGDTLAIGVGNVIGLPVDIDDTDAVYRAYVNNTLVTPDAVATGESTSGVNCSGATYDGAKHMWCLVNPHYRG